MRTQDIEYRADGARLVGQYVVDDTKPGRRAGVLVCHEGPGLTEHTKLWLAIPTKPTDNQLVLKITVAYSGSGTLYWWFGNAQLESGVLVPGHYVPTAGSAITYAVPTQMRGVAKVFRDELEIVQEPYDGIVTPREGQDQSSYVVPHAIDDFRS